MAIRGPDFMAIRGPDFSGLLRFSCSCAAIFRGHACCCRLFLLLLLALGQHIQLSQIVWNLHKCTPQVRSHCIHLRSKHPQQE